MLSWTRLHSVLCRHAMPHLPARLQRDADDQIAEQGGDPQREKRSMRHFKEWLEDLQNLPRPIDVLAFDEPLVRLLVALLEDPLSGTTASQTISQASLARDDNGKAAVVLVTDSVEFLDGRRQIGQMLKNMDGQHPIEVIVREWQPFLTIRCKRPHPRETPANLGAHVGTQLESVVVLLLGSGEL